MELNQDGLPKSYEEFIEAFNSHLVGISEFALSLNADREEITKLLFYVSNNTKFLLGEYTRLINEGKIPKDKQYKSAKNDKRSGEEIIEQGLKDADDSLNKEIK